MGRHAAWQWAARLYDEFSAQRRMEQHAGVDTGVLGSGTTVSTMAFGFIGFVRPAFELFARFSPSLGVNWSRQLEANAVFWASLATAEQLERSKLSVAAPSLRLTRRYSSPESSSISETASWQDAEESEQSVRPALPITRKGSSGTILLWDGRGW